MLKKIISAVAAAAVIFTVQPPASAGDAGKNEITGVAIIHTNDVHCGYAADDSTFGYAELAAYKASLESDGYEVILVDAGDFIQGDVMGTLSDGEYIIDIMNDVGYDFATLGNHEFDYGTDRLFELVDKAEFEVLSANFLDKDGAAIYPQYGIYEANGFKIGFVGICNPQTMKKSNPAFFKDENGEYNYSFCFGDDGKQLYETVQASVNAALEDGADYIVALSHLGVQEIDAAYRSYDLIANTTDIDVVIDAHSHILIDGEVVKNKDGKDAALVSAGTKMLNIGTVFIENGCISTKLIAKGDYEVTTEEDTDEYKAYEEAREKIGEIEKNIGELVNTVVARTDVDLVAVGPDDMTVKTVRFRETNMGDLVADAYRASVGADVGFVNGGGVRDNIPAGDITYGQIIAVQPFGNSICLVEASGQEILDALEIGVRANPEPIGGFLQVSGITYELHNYIPSPVILDENGGFAGFDGEYRVKNVMVGGEPLDTEKIYTVASHNFLIKSGGDGNTVFTDNVILADEAALDNQALIDYITKELGGVIGGEYGNAYGSGRITVFDEAPAAAEINEPDADDEAPGEISGEAASVEDEAPSKESPDTGAGDVSVAAAVIIAAAGALIISSRKRS